MVELLTITIKLSFVLLMLVELLTSNVKCSFVLLILVELLTSTVKLFSSIYFYIAEKIFELTNCENKSLRELHLFNLQICLFRVLYNDARKCL
jgi:hypothetical protein